jgi:hypothetical protein
MLKQYIILCCCIILSLVLADNYTNTWLRDHRYIAGRLDVPVPSNRFVGILYKSIGQKMKHIALDMKLVYQGNCCFIGLIIFRLGIP